MFSNQHPKSYQRFAGRFAQGERRAITAKFNGTCRSCGNPTAEGDTVYWAPGAGAICQACQDGQPVQKVLPQAPQASAPVNDHGIEEWEARAPQAHAQMAVEDAGVYVLPDGTIVKVQANKERTHTYAKRFVEISGERATEAGTRAHGEYRYEPGLIDQVARTGRKMTLEEAKAFIIRYGFCVRCGRHLKAAESVERGIGPVCIRYFESEAHTHEGEGEAEASPEPTVGEALEDAGLVAANPWPTSAPAQDDGRRLYTCVNSRCSNKGTVWEGPTPADSRLATGRPVLCPFCGHSAVWKGRPEPRTAEPTVGLYLAEHVDARGRPTGEEEVDTDAHFARMFERLEDAMFGPGDGI